MAMMIALILSQYIEDENYKQYYYWETLMRSGIDEWSYSGMPECASAMPTKMWYVSV